MEEVALGKAFWRNYFKYYDCLNMLLPYSETLAAVADSLELKRGALVLDLGSGTGNLSLRLKERGFRVIAVDIIKEGLMAHKQKDSKRVAVLTDISYALPFRDNAFDGIASHNVIQHIQPAIRPAVFQEFYRVLKPGGSISFSTARSGFSPKAVYSDHISRERSQIGTFALALKAAKMAIPTVMMFYYNSIACHASGDTIHYLKPGEQAKLLAEAHFRQITDDTPVYASQGILNVARK